MSTQRRTFSNLPGMTAVVDSDTQRIIRWERDERRNPVGDFVTARARNPAELAINDTVDPGLTRENGTMERENQVSEYAGTAVSLIQTGATIFAGQMVADYAFGWIDTQLEGQNKWLRMGVNVLGPATAGAVLYTSTTNTYLRGIALGHAIVSGRKILEVILSYVFPQNGGDSSDANGNQTETDGSETGTQGLRALPALKGGMGMTKYNGMSGGFSSDQPASRGAIAPSGGSRNTVMAGA